jgi:ATP-dependent DNA ligase
MPRKASLRFEPMEAQPVSEIPVGPLWLYEPKWDGFRCLAYRDGNRIELQSKSGQPLARYFPDLVENLRCLPARKFVLDGEIVIPKAGRLSFDDLLLRIHPAASRVQKLANTFPAMFIVFDLLVNERGISLAAKPLADRRKRLETFARKYLATQERIRLSPAANSLTRAQRWFQTSGGDLDGVIAKRLDLPYQGGKRDGMVKVKHYRTVDCVVGGFRYAEGQSYVGSLLLGLYNREGLLDHVGFTSSIKAAERTKLTARLTALIQEPGFTGKAPGGPSRWSTKRSSQWEPVKPKLVVEVAYDHFTGGRFRHGTRLLRWRPDKRPTACTLDQVAAPKGKLLRLLKSASRSKSNA